MKGIAALALVSFLPGSALAQNVFYDEDFESGIPAGWTHVYAGFQEPWYWDPAALATGTGGIFYEYFCNNGGSFRNTILRTAPIDLSGLTNATFQCQQFQLFPFARVYNGVKVTTNNGASYTQIYQETGTWTGTGTIQVDMSAFAGNPNVRLAFHYLGAVANEWHLDDVRILTTNPVCTVTNLAAGQTSTFAVSGVAPGNPVVIALSLTGPGPIPSPFGNIHLTPPILFLPTLVAGPTGEVSVALPVPLGTQGIVVYVQAAEGNPNGTLDLSNSIARPIQ